MPDSEEDLLFFIVDVNGIHNTKLQFCHCPGADNRVVSDLYSQFCIVMQVWTVLTATKHLGQAHDIDDALPHRPKGSLIVYCPACPEPHFNMLPGWEKTPPEFRHLIQMQMMLNGNFHLNRYIKNTDPHDTSLFRGLAYIPDDQVYQDYVKKIVLATKADQNAVKKFKNMAVSGSANGQCGHVFIKLSIDLQMREWFVNVDYAVAHALRQQRICGSADESQGTLDLLISYDISCALKMLSAGRFQ
ncbi:hypothetical protein BDZ97DRAFT_2061764 [Flammula alnicola]|nr:hypothetical protein BDZ97DRAFT_2061764 [Flammula alnicola]